MRQIMMAFVAALVALSGPVTVRAAEPEAAPAPVPATPAAAPTFTAAPATPTPAPVVANATSAVNPTPSGEAVPVPVTAKPVDPETELKALREEVKKINALSEELKLLTDKYNAMQATAKSATPAAADAALEKKYGPGAGAITRAGNLKIGGLLQAWYYHVQHDDRGVFDIPSIGIADSNSAANTDSFRIRRAELRFKMDANEHVSSYLMLDPANEATSFPQFGVGTHRLANVSPEFQNANGTATVNGLNVIPGATATALEAVQNGSGTSNRLLQDALINFHGILPHHDVTVGQMLPTFNEETITDNGSLSFVERSYIGNSVSRDIGAVLHGSWWCNGISNTDVRGGVYQGLGDSGRVQYWLGAYNGSGNLFGTRGSSANRSDTNDQKDFIGTLLVRPMWDECLGQLELGYSFRAGHHGNSGLSGGTTNAGFLGVNTSSMGHDAWAKYYAPGPLKGLWFKGEGMWLKDRNGGGSVIDLSMASFQLDDGSGNALLAGNPQPVSTFGYWAAMGYKLADCPLLCPGDNSFWRNFEFAFRFEHAPNVFVAKPDPNFTSVYSSKVYTAGINYYIRCDNAKLQANYNLVQNPDGPNGQAFHKTRNDSFIINFQVMW